MGYYTHFNLTKPECPILRGKLAKEINEFLGFPVLDEEGYCNEPCKWYEYKEDMCRISKGYPETLITLSGEGEESGDLWDCHFLDGKFHLCGAKIVYPEFDPAKLEEPSA